ncbi:tail protein X [Terrihabitans rhizophilus]|uniref:Tail protein X n=1 Tax=Terrihabitans rhizophilus TaxID=3092662 RepID=A0ABU4RN86_9HYPH|nr:tail protein X [Terrihabitans sp. PJ23]MDX6806299.1 tail protein X [Terrihabitans sp. PJ23]
MPKKITVRGDNILLDQILHRELGPVLARTLLAETLLLNPGLADEGAVLPMGRTILIPDRPTTRAAVVQPVSLFGSA